MGMERDVYLWGSVCVCVHTHACRCARLFPYVTVQKPKLLKSLNRCGLEIFLKNEATLHFLELQNDSHA